jgi:hypothetical protein
MSEQTKESYLYMLPPNFNRFYKSIESIFHEIGIPMPKLELVYHRKSTMPEKCSNNIKEFKPENHPARRDTKFLFGDSKYCNLEKLASIYRQIIDAAEASSVHYIFAVNIFLCLLRQNGVYSVHTEIGEAAKILEKIWQDRKSFPDYHYAKGMLYFSYCETRKKLCYNSILENGKIRVDIRYPHGYFLALKNFVKCIQANFDNTELYYLIASCYANLGYYIEAITILSEADKLFWSSENFHSTNLFPVLTSALQMLMVKLSVEENYDKAYDMAKRLYLIRPLARETCLALFVVFHRCGKYFNAIQALSYLRKRGSTSSLIPHLMGLCYLRVRKFYFASIYFRHTINTLKDPGFSYATNIHGDTDREFFTDQKIPSLLYNLSLGLWFLSKQALNKADKYLRHSLRLAHILSRPPNFGEPPNLKYSDIYALIIKLLQLAHIDNLLTKLLESKAIKEFRSNFNSNRKWLLNTINYVDFFFNTFINHFPRFSDNMLYFGSKDMDYDKKTYAGVKFNPDRIILQKYYNRREKYFVFAKVYFISVLAVVFNIEGWSGEIREIYKRDLDKDLAIKTDDIDLFEIIIMHTHICVEMFEQLGFKKHVSAFNNLNKLIQKSRERSWQNLSKEDWVESINTMSTSLLTIGPDLTNLSIDPVVSEIEQKLETALKTIKIRRYPLIKESKSELKNLTKDIDKVIKDYRGKLISEIKKSVKIKVPHYFIEFKGRAVNVYLNAQLQSEPLFVGKRNWQSYQLLEHFLARKDNQVHWTSAIKIFNDWRGKRNDIHTLKKNFAQVITDIRTEFRKNNLAPVKIANAHHGFWKIASKASSNIAISHALLEKAQLNIEKNMLSQAKSNLESAFDVYDRCYDAANSVLLFRNKIEFDAGVIEKSQRLLADRKLELKEVKKTIELHLRKRKYKKWQKQWGKKQAEKIEFNHLEIIATEVAYELKELEQVRQEISYIDKEYERVKNLILNRRYDQLLQESKTKEIINRMYNEIRKMQTKGFHESNWVWFRQFKDNELIEKIKLWLCEAIEMNVRKKRIKFSIARNLNTLSSYLYKITKGKIVNELYQAVTEIPPKEINTYFKAVKLIEKIKRERGELTERELTLLLAEQTEKSTLYAQYLIDLYNTGQRKVPYTDEILSKKEARWWKSPYEPNQ